MPAKSKSKTQFAEDQKPRNCMQIQVTEPMQQCIDILTAHYQGQKVPLSLNRQQIVGLAIDNGFRSICGRLGIELPEGKINGE